MKIGVIGTGYVGLVAGACFADTGNQVICVDRDAKKIERLKKGEIPIYEPGLEEIVARTQKAGRIEFTTDLDFAVREASVLFLAVGTPEGENGEPDLTALKQVAFAVGESMERNKSEFRLVVNKSTVPIGAHRTVSGWIRERTSRPHEVVSNPEFLKEGSAIQDFLKPDRIVVGATTDQSFAMLKELYAPFVRQGNPIITMDPISAEMTKYACNAFLATRISFMNELSVLCDAVGGDIEMIRAGMVSDERIGKHFLYAGAGYGGSCFPKDVQALVASGKRMGVPLEIASAAERANDRQKHRVVDLLKAHYKTDSFTGKKIALWGLAFKPNTDDVREAPALIIAAELVKMGAKVSGFDPVAHDTTRAEIGDLIEYAPNALEAARGADALVLATEWNEFRHPDWNAVRSAMKPSPLLVDGRNVYSPKALREAGFAYVGIGRK